MHCWRLPDGGVLVRAADPRGVPAYHHLARSRLVRSYWPQYGDDCEIGYTYGYRVVDDRFERCTTAEIGRPYSSRTTGGEVLARGLVALPEGAVGGPELAAALALDPLVERVYAAFADCPKPARVAGCPHCRPPDADCPLLARPPRLLEPDALEDYLFSAVTTWGTAADFRYFAPRVLHLAVTERIAYPDLEIVLGKLPLAGWPAWPAAQRTAVAGLLDHWWTLTLAAYPGPRAAAGVLGALGMAVDIGPLLDRWAALDTDAAALHLRDFVRDSVTDARSGTLRVPFWDSLSRSRRLAEWMLSPGLATAVEEAFLRDGGRAAAAALDELDGYLVPR